MVDRRSHVLHISPYMHPAAGGPPVVVDRLCRQLALRGWPVEVVTTDHMAPSTDRQWVNSYADAYPIRVLSSGELGGWRCSAAACAAIEAAVLRARLVHLHCLWSRVNRLAAKFCGKHAVPYLVMPHGMLDPHSLARKRYKKMLFGALIEWSHLRGAAGMIYTHAEERRLAESMVTRLSDGHVVPLATDDPPQIERARLAARFLQEYPHLSDNQLVVFLSRLHEKKGLDLLIPAFATVVRNNPKAHLLLVGHGEASYTQQLRDRVGQYQLESQVTFTGPRTGDAKWSVLAAGTVFVLPSYQENFAIAVAEAMTMGLPIVLSGRVNICGDVVAAGAGIECELNPPAIAAAIFQVLSDSGLAKSMGDAAQNAARKQYTWSNSASVTEGVYQKYLAGIAEDTHVTGITVRST